MGDLARFGGRALRTAALFLMTSGAAVATAAASDVAPTADGAQKLDALFATYLGANVAATTTQGDHYVVSIDVAKLLAPLAAEGVKIDMAAPQLNLTEQSDGTWRVTRDGYPPVNVHFKDGDISANFDSYKFAGVYDPAIFGFRDAKGDSDKGAFQVHSPEVDETGGFGSLHFAMTGAGAAAGGLSGTVHEEVNDLSVVALSKKAEASAGSPPAPVTIRSEGMTVDVKFDNVRARQLIDLWAFLVAHPSRAELAANQDALKTKLLALLPFADKLDETFALRKLSVETPKGLVKLASVNGHFAADQFPSKGGNELHLAFEGVEPPPNAVPAAFQPFIPTAMDLNVRYSGYDYGAAAAEAIKDLDLAGEGPVIPEADRPQIAARMMSGGPIVVTIQHSRILAPQLDLSVEGEIRVTGAHPEGKIIVKAHDFEKTFAAVKGMGPLATPQVIAGITMAKGLAKADPADGTLIWVAEYGPDGAMKVNGLPLGKAPPQ
ncbi:MAG TPA: DUF2125 domain-containing protein [Roseiarcus sp.]|nr:DUF2125 domain-containing protein [Roseiarcus sp.]